MISDDVNCVNTKRQGEKIMSHTCIEIKIHIYGGVYYDIIPHQIQNCYIRRIYLHKKIFI